MDFVSCSEMRAIIYAEKNEDEFEIFADFYGNHF